MRRRGTILLALLVGLTGCLSHGIGGGAAPAGVPADALDDAGFVGPAPRAVNVTVPVGIGPVVVNANVTSHVVLYADANADVFTNGTAVGGGAAAASPPANETPTTLVVLSTPGFRTAGVTLNPLTRRPDPAMVKRIADITDQVPGFPRADLSGEVHAVNSSEQTILGRVATVTTYAGTRSGVTRLTLATVEHDGDVVVLVGTHNGDGSTAQLVDLMTRVEHPADVAGNLPTETRTAIQ
jgi:hypothetical protein